MIKKCSLCAEEKDASIFYKDRQKKDGLTSACKQCMNKKSSAYAKTDRGREVLRVYGRSIKSKPENRAKDLARVLAYQKTPAGREVRKRAFKKYTSTTRGRSAMNAANRKYSAQNPEKVRCRNETKRAIKAGILTRSPCEKCGATKSQAHHEDYSQPLKITWVCQRHHAEIHHG